MAESISAPGVSTAKAGRSTRVGAAHIPWVFFAPQKLFARVEDVPSYTWPLMILLTLTTLMGFAMVETGLVDRQMDRETDRVIADLEKLNVDVVARSELSKMIEEVRKGGEFNKMLARGQAVIINPLWVLVSCMLVAACLYGAVALTGRKPEWNTLLTICVYASFIEFLRLIFSLVLILNYGTLAVSTSPAILLERIPLGLEGPSAPTALAALRGALEGLDPFVIWFWLVVMIGVTTTRQLGKLGAVIACCLMWLISTGIGVGMHVAQAQSMTSGMNG